MSIAGRGCIALLIMTWSACTHSTTSSAAPPLPPAKLGFVEQPISSQLGHPVAVWVAIQDSSGATVDTAARTVTLALGANSANGNLLGTTTANALGGIAVFPNLRIDRFGTGFTLAARSPSLEGATSLAFDVLPLPVARVFLSAGAFNTCGVALAPAAYCWGDNRFGQLGDSANADTASPAAVRGGLSFAAIGGDAAGSHRCGVTAAGAAYCWGSNAYGELGDGSDTNRATPVAVAGGLTFAMVNTGGGSNTCGITTTGKAYCWGINYTGQLGIGTTTGPEDCSGNPCSMTPVAVAGGFSFTTISVGNGHTCALAVSGAAYCWGPNRTGQLGVGSNAEPQQCAYGYSCSPTPMLVVGGLTFATVSAGIGYTCGVTTAGATYCWGYNATGQLGDGTTTEQDSPVVVGGGLTFVLVTTGGDRGGYGHACALTSLGAAYCWGADETGQLGIGSYGYTFSPTPVPVTGGHTFVAITAGSNDNGFDGQAHTCGVTTGGMAYCWGDNSHGQLGVGTNTGPQTCVISDPCSTIPVAVVGRLDFGQ